MRLVIFGATGGAGTHLVSQALAAGHEVTAAVRDPARVPARSGLRVLQTDVSDAASVARALEGQEAALSAIGPRPAIAPGTLISDSVRAIVAGMKQHGVRKVVLASGLMLAGGAGIGLHKRLLISIFRLLNGALYRDKLIAERLLQESGLEWVIVRPPVFKDLPARGTWRMDENLDVKLSAMSAADVAGAMLEALSEDRFARKAVEVSN